MSVEEINKTFYEETNRRLKNTSQLKLFSILKDVETNTKYLNIFKSYVINEEIRQKVLYNVYEVEEDEFWDNISTKLYGIPDIWWIIPLMNNVINPFEYLEPGKQIFVLKQKYLYQILKEISNIGNI